ncbi:MAG TPA: hypothetical protein DD723_10620 [Candidatus Omnitrophica bacterium]|nr:MAG: hypothetical protein A2Z81_09730 [Omnitrophica WOR_2 bacterium GWA2_45_18]HBR15970.1 hypothetical protein [Candidatus Omnitrophota bacterium]
MAKTAVIMQPTYLPWQGYFDLMDQSDVFVLLDSVQFDKRSWQQRNRVKTSRGECMLTVPVLTKGKSLQKICEVEIDATSKFCAEHLKAIELNYAKARYFRQYIDSLRGIYLKQPKYLCDLTVDMIFWIKNVLGIRAELLRSSSLGVEGTKADLLVEICRKTGADVYLSPARSRDYIGDGRLFTDHGIALLYHHYTPPVYTQLFGDFIPYLSVLDLIFNEGDRSLSVIRSGRRESLKGNTHDELPSVNVTGNC